ncbi:hypothetical protein [Winogradskyella sp. 3972H.M.0a.05]|uniref:hypothetical protein n=1 Tax=Winogradskyella sp. 3972H.M.0a.05 TaxID=2950277 RepID=UPI003397502A
MALLQITVQHYTNMDNNTIEQGKTLAFVSYLTLIGTLIAFFLNQDKRNSFTAFHTRQALGLWLLYMLLGYFISSFNSWMITMSFWVFIGTLILYGIFGALSGKLTKVPFLGDFFQKTFQSLGK